MLLRNHPIAIFSSFDCLIASYLVQFLRFGEFFVVNVWCCSYFL